MIIATLIQKCTTISPRETHLGQIAASDCPRSSLRRLRGWRTVPTAVFVCFAVGSGGAWACEDEHPPIVATPVAEFTLAAADGATLLNLAVDPRGVGAVTPIGDEGDRWIDTDNPTGAWHYREWQWWKGHPWGDSCRPRYYSQVTFQPRPPSPGRPGGAVIDYRIDGFDCRQVFLIPAAVENPEAPHWDLVVTVRNVSGRDVEEYGQFFACYTPLNRGRSFWFWDESDELVLFSERGVSHLDGYVAHPDSYFFEAGAIPHCPRGDGRVVGRWRRPVLVSHASPGGWRSVILIESEFTAALAQGIRGGAMDYILFPGPQQRVFENEGEFTACIRHVMLPSPELPTIQRLEELWEDFRQSHAAVRQQASRL